MPMNLLRVQIGLQNMDTGTETLPTGLSKSAFQALTRDRIWKLAWLANWVSRLRQQTQIFAN